MTKLLISIKLSKLGKLIFTLLTNKWHINQVYNNYIGKPLLNFGHEISYKVLDRGYIEVAGPLGVTKGFSLLTNKFSKLQIGWIYNYAFTMFVFATLAILFVGVGVDVTMNLSDLLLGMLVFIIL